MYDPRIDRNMSITVANRQKLEDGVSVGMLLLEDEESGLNFTISNVSSHPGMDQYLISVVQISKEGKTVLFRDDHALILAAPGDLIMIAHRNVNDGLCNI